MPHHLMNLRHVPGDEADDIRDLFEREQVRYYETPPSFWGISMGGFWVHDDDEAERARKLLAEYQQQRQTWQHEQWQERVARGDAGYGSMLRRHPVRMLAAIIALAVIVGLSLLPYLRIGE